MSCAAPGPALALDAIGGGGGGGGAITLCPHLFHWGHAQAAFSSCSPRAEYV